MGRKIIRRGGKIVTKSRLTRLERQARLAEISRIHELQEIEEKIMNELKLGEEEYLPLTWETDLMTTTDSDTATYLIDTYKYKLEIIYLQEEGKINHLYKKSNKKIKKDKKLV